MVRRKFLATLLGGAAAAWPRAAHAQQTRAMRRIGILAQGAANDPETAARLTAFVQGLQELGWSIGRNARIEYRWADGDMTLIRKHAAELLAFEPDVIMAAGGLGVRPLLDLTSTVPIVFDALDPVTCISRSPQHRLGRAIQLNSSGGATARCRAVSDRRSKRGLN